jgi:hypothetical protein
MPASSDRGAENVRRANPRMGTDNPRRRAAIHQTGDRKKHAPLPSSAFMIEPESTTVTVAEEPKGDTEVRVCMLATGFGWGSNRELRRRGIYH